MRSTRLLVLFLVATLLAAACGRSDGEAESGGADTAPTETSAPDGGDGSPGSDVDLTSIAEGGFGDLEAVCSEGDAAGATDQGVTDDSIQVGTFSDKGAEVRPGLTKELYDAAVAFAAWCNDNGGINGRPVDVVTEDDGTDPKRGA